MSGEVDLVLVPKGREGPQGRGNDNPALLYTVYCGAMITLQYSTVYCDPKCNEMHNAKAAGHWERKPSTLHNTVHTVMQNAEYDAYYN